jgi:hypothetical protein
VVARGLTKSRKPQNKFSPYPESFIKGVFLPGYPCSGRNMLIFERY